MTSAQRPAPSAQRPALQRFRPANQDRALYAVGTVSPPQDAVLALARLIGRQIAREEFQRSFNAANDHAPRSETDQGS
ncbi:MAG: hypothetical protein V4514_02405 [Pseudomonadota bacterium]|uniref:hypothetical protein n=1 Tax=unclassified Phenylobacterium TaxID=2640670 RepID=UPI0006F1EE8B|nr:MULTISPECIES: hypothetical protein [unclassified Phenylobacterium]KRB49551.1 hypothetical protein ASE02_17235 [Phenylobacterium sp. Root700]MBT9470002.1 hypothetical protein [Phenylobacterium sp.]